MCVENIRDFCVLYKSVYADTISEKKILQKYRSPYAHSDYFGNIAYHEERPIAFYGAIPVLMKHEDSIEMGAQSVDSMTHPNYRGLGLFTQLAKCTFLQLQKAGITFIWGFTNQNSMPIFKAKLNWNFAPNIRGYKIQVLTIPIEKLAKKSKPTKKYYDRLTENYFSKYRVKKVPRGSVYMEKGVVSVQRDLSYYQQKSANKNYIIELEGCLFWIKTNNGLRIGDIEISSKKHFIKALLSLLKIAKRIGTSEIIFQTSMHTFIDDLFKNSGYTSFESWPIGYQNFSSKFPLDQLKFTLGDLDKF